MAEEAGEAVYLDYAIRWRTGQAMAGRHAARQAGLGGGFRAYRPFWQCPDASRIDIRRSLMDPFGALVVRQTDDRSAIAVILAVDVSRSMQAAPGAGNLPAIGALARSAALSAHRAGDRFGLVAFDDDLRADLCLAPTRSRSAALAAIARFAEGTGRAGGSGGIKTLRDALPLQRALILLASDFLLPLPECEAALARLARHDVAPIVFHEPREAALPQTGLLRLQDSESGQRRMLWLRPSLLQRWQRERAARRQALDALFLRYGRPGFHVEGKLDIASLGEHLRGA